MKPVQHIAGLFLAHALIDGPLNYAERELIFRCLQSWKDDLDRAGYLSLLRSIGEPLQATDGAPEAIAAIAEQHAIALRPWVSKSRKRSVMLLYHLCQIAQVDSVLHPREQRLLRRTLRHLELGGRISIDITDDLAALSYAKRPAG